MHTPSAFGLDVAEPLPDGSIGLTCRASKGWTGRKRGVQTRAEHPGTAVRWQEEIYEVVEANPLATGATRYRLAAWQERHAIRVIENYDASSEAARQTERDRRSDSVRDRRLAILFAPVLGHLPGPVQERLESEIGAPARAMTVVSALPFLVLGMLGLLSYVSTVFGAPPLFGWAPPVAVSIFFAAESAVRIGSAWIAGQPMGSVAGTAVYRLVLFARGRQTATSPANAPPAGLSDREAFRLLEPVLSLLPGPDQQRLERRYSFAWQRWGRRSAALLFVLGAVNVLSSLAAFAGNMAGTGDVVWLFAGTVLCVEQGLRWKDISRGRPRGSALGIAVRPLARALLRFEKSPAPSEPAPTA